MAGTMWLTVRSGETRGTTISLGDGDELVLGRDDDCDVVVPDSKVSRRHVSLARLPDGRIVLRDLGSSNGTLVNGRPVETAQLDGDDQIQLGDTVLTTSFDEPTAPVRSTVVGSGIHRFVLQRSVRRATILAGAAVLVTGTLGGLFVTGVLPPDRSRAAVARVVKQAGPATVLLEAERAGKRVGTGSGWVVDASQGLVVTNAHVVNRGSSFRVGVANGFRPAEIVAVAPCDDLALLRLGDRRGLAQLPLGNQKSLKQGETVVAVGYPANASQEATLTSTTGVVSLVRTSYREPALDVPRYPNLIQTDAAINPGNSGGPLLDLDGKVVGVNAAGRTVAPDGRIIQGQSYAIGIDRVKEVVSVLRTGRSIGWAGLSLEFPTPRELAAKRLPVGLIAASSAPGTDAERQGLGAGRTVITAIDGRPVDNSLASYCDAVADVKSGQSVAMTVVEGANARPSVIEVVME